ncbi:hypothetical protein ACQZ5N_01040 [Agrobacterium sp. 22-221-1]
MNVADAVIDRIQQRRTKLERAGIFTPDAKVATNSALSIWQIGEYGDAFRCFDTPPVEQASQTVLVIPAAKFLPERPDWIEQIPDDMWIAGFAHLDVLPEQQPRIPVLVDAPANPEQPTRENADTASITGVTHVDAPAPKATRPDEIDRNAVLVDLQKYKEANRDRTRARKAEIAAELNAEIDEILASLRDDKKPNIARPIGLSAAGREHASDITTS